MSLPTLRSFWNALGPQSPTPFTAFHLRSPFTCNLSSRVTSSHLCLCKSHIHFGSHSPATSHPQPLTCVPCGSSHLQPSCAACDPLTSRNLPPFAVPSDRAWASVDRCGIWLQQQSPLWCTAGAINGVLTDLYRSTPLLAPLPYPCSDLLICDTFTPFIHWLKRGIIHLFNCSI